MTQPTPLAMTEETRAEPVEETVARSSLPLRTARRLSWLVAALMAGSAAAGLAAEELYKDPSPLREMFRGYDLVTLAVVVPTMVGVLLMRRTLRRDAVWLATLAFAVYNYALYVFGASFNGVLVHVGILLAAAVALGVGVSAVHADVRGASFPQMPRRRVAAVLLLLAVPLASMWVYYSLRFTFTGQLPEESYLVLPDASVHLGYALDLALLIPAYAAAAVLLLRRSPWGIVLAPVLLVSGAVHQLSYMSALVFQSAADIPGSSAFDPSEPLILAAYAVAAALMLRSLGGRGGRRSSSGDDAGPLATFAATSWLPVAPFRRQPAERTRRWPEKGEWS